MNKCTAMELAGWARQEALYHRADAERARAAAAGGFGAGNGREALGHEAQAERLEALAWCAERQSERSQN